MDQNQGRDEPRWSLLDGVAFVMGAAVASVHLKDRVAPGESPSGPGWLVLVTMFALLGLTASGPALYCVRRFVRPTPGFPTDGDRAWMALGLPWLLTALGRSALGAASQDESLAIALPFLMVGLSFASLYALIVVLRRVGVLRRPSAEPLPDVRPLPSEKIGLALANLWPLQFGLALLLSD